MQAHARTCSDDSQLTPSSYVSAVVWWWSRLRALHRGPSHQCAWAPELGPTHCLHSRCRVRLARGFWQPILRATKGEEAWYRIHEHTFQREQSLGPSHIYTHLHTYGVNPKSGLFKAEHFSPNNPWPNAAISQKMAYEPRGDHQDRTGGAGGYGGPGASDGTYVRARGRRTFPFCMASTLSAIAPVERQTRSSAAGH